MTSVWPTHTQSCRGSGCSGSSSTTSQEPQPLEIRDITKEAAEICVGNLNLCLCCVLNHHAELVTEDSNDDRFHRSTRRRPTSKSVVVLQAFRIPSRPSEKCPRLAYAFERIREFSLGAVGAKVDRIEGVHLWNDGWSCATSGLRVAPRTKTLTGSCRPSLSSMTMCSSGWSMHKKRHVCTCM